MEDSFVSVFLTVISLLLSKDHILRDQDDNITASMQDHNLWLQSFAKLEEPSIAPDLPRSNQQAPQILGGEGDMSDVKQMMPNVRTAVAHKEQIAGAPICYKITNISSAGDQNNFSQTTIAPDELEKLDASGDKWTSHMSNTVDQTGSNVDQNFSQGDEELPKKGQIDTHHDNQESFMGQENAYSWYLWKILSVISLIRFLNWIVKLDIKATMLSSQSGKKTTTFLNTKVCEMDYKTLTSFYEQCVQVPTSKSSQTCEFESFVHDLLESVGSKDPHVKIEKCVGVGHLHEPQSLRKSQIHDIHVAIIPPEYYSFEFELLRDRTASSALCSKVKIVKVTDSSICVCSDSIQHDDTLCLLHPDIKNNNAGDYFKGHMCQEDSPYLSTTLVVKWFKNAIKQSWEEIGHKYDSELTFHNRESPGSLRVRFRSGETILFNITPVVQFRDSNAHLISYLPSIRDLSDTHWPLCFKCYENSLLQHFSNMLSYNSCHISCLRILSFLHERQINLTEKCGLRSHHLRNALLHQLLVDTPSSWQPEQIGQRLNDVLTFLQQRVKAKVLHHALVGNNLIPSDFGLPKEFREGKPINLFQPLLSNEELCLKTDRHIVEMIKNIPVLIYEYSTK